MYDNVTRTFLWKVLALVGIPQKVYSVISQFYDGMRACVRLDDSECSDWFHRGCVLMPLLFNIFPAVKHMTLMRFEAGKDNMDTLGGITKKTGAGGEG